MPAEYVDLPIYRDGLASGLGFTPSDLDSNRAGRLSASQRASLLRTDDVRIGAAALCLLAAVGSIGVAFAIGTGRGPVVQALLVAASLLFAAGALAWNSFNLWRDLMDAAVSSVEGLVEPTDREVDMARAGTVWRYFWVVGDQRFAVSPKAFAVLTKARHRLYFLPRTRRVVAAEPISTGQ